jgi:hypothetical protein
MVKSRLFSEKGSMRVNLRRGLARLYLVFWAIWLVYFLALIWVFPTAGGWTIKLALVALFGVLVPGVLFVALRWAAAGFVAESTETATSRSPKTM